MTIQPGGIIPLPLRDEATSVAARAVALAGDGIAALQACFRDPTFSSNFERLVKLISGSRGRVILAGMGKSGIIARKVTATLTSTGVPATFLHPAEAGHGDLGMITQDDVVLVISHSGESSELATIFSYCKRFAIPIVTITAQPESTAAKAADFHIRLPAVREACPIQLSPTTSTTVQLVFGDALAMTLMAGRGFSADDFHSLHPNGRLGARLLKVRDVMAKGADVPRITPDASLLDATIEMTRTRLGGTAVVDTQGRLVGAFTDGDLRRTVTVERTLTDSVSKYMSRSPLCIGPGELASEAVRLMHERNVMLLFVREGEGLVGVVHMHDVLRAGVV
ncbi:KpsF/GutQ family sugar-phosphate isomerase [Sphingomonas sp. IC4-52]|uniref:KpsF/GutQ family sugar-phosphate isomerase n=1 Tax=Sphingomonas sp. IC4-52 TaxID=2887202 RepID=UPI001D0FB720|nr:KpsF/GutQ family sugar-phosphate isomerase [Sphingomonas sp. IC4-52]MCC2978671.1 KpsF/GutQ family sugar-phosphate isomerase [Sphingomonas sp. IC4-52]